MMSYPVTYNNGQIVLRLINLNMKGNVILGLVHQHGTVSWPGLT